MFQKNPCLDHNVMPPVLGPDGGMKVTGDHVSTSSEGKDIWEIDSSLLTYEKKIASGSNGDL